MPPPPPRAPKPTHFLCLPLTTPAARPQLERAARRFRESLWGASGGELDPAALGRAVRPVGTLHLTLGVMALRDGGGESAGKTVEDACGLLRGLDLAALLRASTALHTSSAHTDGASTAPTTPTTVATPSTLAPLAPLTITLRSLASMKRGHRTSSLFAVPVDATDRLQPFCEALRARFVDAGLVLPEQRGLTLHATVLNTVYAPGGARGRRARVFDATGVLDEFAGFVWAEGVRVERVAVCRMGAQRVPGENGQGGVVDEAYEEVAAVGMPGA